MITFTPIDLIIMEFGVQKLMKETDLGLECGRQCAFALGKIENMLGQMTSQIPPAHGTAVPPPESFIKET